MPKYSVDMHDARSLRNYADQLRKAQQTIEDYVRAMDEDRIEKLEIRGATTSMRGLDYIGKFAESVREAYLKFRHDRGDFRAQD